MSSSALVVFVSWISMMPYPTLGQGPCRRLKFSPPIDGYVLQGHVINNISLNVHLVENTPSRCNNYCTMESKCVSFNIGPPSKDTVLCQLNDADHIQHPKDLQAWEGFMYRSTENPCSSNPCPHNATCLNGFAPSGYLCQCQVGYGGQRCEEDVDECVSGLHACDVDSYCSNTVGSYICKNHRGVGTSIILSGQLEHQKYVETLALFLDPVLMNSSLSRFVRCYHALTDGWQSMTFHTKCDGKGPTVTIIKVNDFIFGGYTDVSWHSSCSYSSAAKAFIFSLHNTNGYDPVKLPQHQHLNKAMYSCTSYGPTFGGNLGQHDIYTPNDAVNKQTAFTYCGSTYSLPPGNSVGYCAFFAGKSKFTPTDIEVFYETTS